MLARQIRTLHSGIFHPFPPRPMAYSYHSTEIPNGGADLCACTHLRKSDVLSKKCFLVGICITGASYRNAAFGSVSLSEVWDSALLTAPKSCQSCRSTNHMERCDWITSGDLGIMFIACRTTGLQRPGTPPPRVPEVQPCSDALVYRHSILLSQGTLAMTRRCPLEVC